MKSFIRNVAVNTFALFFLPVLVPGVTLSGGVATLLFAGILLTLMTMVLKPVLNVLSFPFNLVTLGLFSILTNALILYLLTVFVPGIIIHAFTYPGASIAGFIVPSFHLSTLFAFIASSVVLSLIVTVVQWLIE